MATKKIIRLAKNRHEVVFPDGYTAILENSNLEFIRGWIGEIEYRDWRMGKGDYKKMAHPIFDVYTVKNGKKSKSGSIVFYKAYPLWLARGKTYGIKPGGKITESLRV